MSIESCPASTKVISKITPSQYRDVSAPTFSTKLKDLLAVQASASNDADKAEKVAILAEEILQKYNAFLFNHGYSLKKLLFLYEKTPDAKIATATLSELESLHLFLTDIVGRHGQVLIEEEEV